MKYRKLGKTGIEISEIGFGTWGLGGNSYGPADDQESITSLRSAFDKGVTFYDTSDLYGNGHAETVVGEAFKNDRDKIIIGTKGGLLPHSGFEMPMDFSAEYLRSALDKSLSRLRTDYVDLYLLHSPTLKEIEPALATLREMRKEGKIRSLGVSVRSPNDGKQIVEQYDVDAIQVNFNIIDHRAVENGLFGLAQEKGIGIIARTPLAFGYLTGSLTGKESFGGIDHRNNWPKDQLQRWASAPGVFSFLQNKDRTPTQAALLWCLAQKEISTVIPGMMNLDHVAENTAASSLPSLSQDEIEKVFRAYKENEEKFYNKSFVKVNPKEEKELEL